ALLGGVVLHMACLVPQANHRVGRLPLVAECAQARRAQHEEPAVDARRDAEPARRQHTAEVTAREQEHVTPKGARALDHPGGPRADLLGCRAPGTAIAEELPVWTLRTDLCGATALVLAVVPLDQLGIDLRNRGEAGQLTRPGRSLQGTGEHP